MSESDTVEKLRHAYQQWHDTRGKSAATWVALMADDFEMRSVADGAPGMEFSAPRKGKGAAHGYFSGLEADWEMIRFTIDDMLIDGDRAAVFGSCEYKHRRTGKTANSLIAHRWRFHDGLAVEFFEFYDTARAFAAAAPDQA